MNLTAASISSTPVLHYQMVASADMTSSFEGNQIGVDEHGRIDKVLDPQKLNSFPTEVQEFRRMVCHLAILSILNGKLKEFATRLAVGAVVQLDFIAKMGVEEMNAMRNPKAPYPCW